MTDAGSKGSVVVELGTTGGIGVVRCGTSLTDIAAVLGPPRDLGRVRKRFRWPHRFCYGPVEFAVCQCRTVTSVSLSVDTDLLGCEQVAVALRGAGCCLRPNPNQPPGQVAVTTDPTEAIRAEFVFVPVAFAPASDLLVKAGAWLSTSHVCAPVSAEADDGFGLES